MVELLNKYNTKSALNYYNVVVSEDIQTMNLYIVLTMLAPMIRLNHGSLFLCLINYLYMSGLDLYGVDGYLLQPEYQFSNMWYLVFEDYLTLDFHIKSASIPFPAIQWGNTSFGRVYAEGMEPKNDMTLTFRENIRFSTFNFFNEWMNDIYDFENHVFQPDFMKQTRQASIMFLRRPSFGSSVGSQIAESAVLQPTKIFNIKHILPSGISDLPLDSENGEPLEFTVNLKFDNMSSPFIAKQIMDKAKTLFEK